MPTTNTLRESYLNGYWIGVRVGLHGFKGKRTKNKPPTVQPSKAFKTGYRRGLADAARASRFAKLYEETVNKRGLAEATKKAKIKGIDDSLVFGVATLTPEESKRAYGDDHEPPLKAWRLVCSSCGHQFPDNTAMNPNQVDCCSKPRLHVHT